jgi:hypothetical protein
MKKPDKYIETVMEHVYGILNKPYTPWPKTFNSIDKIQVIDIHLEYWQELEDYEKCLKLKKLKESITNTK